MNRGLRGKRVLIVEDEVVTGELLRSCVKGAGGIPIGPAPSGQSAMDSVSRELPDAALLEASLRDGSSVQVARRLETCGVPYAVLTCPTDQSHPIELRRALYLEKPIAPALLAETLERLLDVVEDVSISRETPTRTIGLVSAMIVLAGIAGWFLHETSSASDIAHEVADARLASRQEHEKSLQLEQLLADSSQKLSANAVTAADAAALQQKVTSLGKTLQDERAHSASLSQDLHAARRENEAQMVALNRANDRPDTSQQLAETQQALQKEQSKSEALARDLATVRRENEAQAVALKKADDRPDASQQLAAMQQALQKEQSRTEGLSRDLLALRTENETQAAALKKATDAQTATVAPQAEAPATKPPAPVLPAADPETRRLMARAQQLIEQRNIMAARSMLERAAESGHPLALFALAETYDPNKLADWGTVGTQGDPTQAREFYQKARAGGLAEAQARLTALQP
jgi:DNA-binding response OmpR family regulator